MSLRQFVAIAKANPDSERQSPGYGRAMHHRFFQAGLALTAQHRPVADEGFRPGRFDGCRAAPLIVPVIPIVPAEAEASEMQGVYAVGLVHNALGAAIALGATAIPRTAATINAVRFFLNIVLLLTHPRTQFGSLIHSVVGWTLTQPT